MDGSAPTCEVVEPADPPVSDSFTACSEDVCPAQNSVCVPTTVLESLGTPASSIELLGACDAENKCVPREFVDATGKFIQPTCESVACAEGRCLSSCIPQVATQADLLPQADCADGQLCAPCTDPRTGALTGACSQGCDPGPQEPPVVFAECCGGAGFCVPPEVVPEADRGLLGADTCTGAGELCAPEALSDSTFVPATCTSLAGAEGRCLPDCIPQVSDQGDRLPVDTCNPGERCAPCYDPTNGELTGACNRGGDMPTEEPVIFADCCGAVGSCIPLDILTPDQEASLGQDTCEAGSLCAPDVFATSGLRAETCESIDGAEGRCLPTCVPLVAEQGDRLPQSTCEANEKCAPCTDPLTGEDTTACSQNGDAPTEPPYTFPQCCSGIGVCVPESLVPAEQQSLLGVDTCTGTDRLCAPETLAGSSDARPASCTGFGSQQREGRCMAACIPQVAERAEQLEQLTCATGELCAPCYDPVNGGSTGACEVNGDAPVEPDPGPFLECGARASILGIPFPPVEGRCVPTYLVDPAQAGLLAPSDVCVNGDPCTCETGELCAPCVSPLDNLPTGACPAP
jgi:hypothetical protein